MGEMAHAEVTNDDRAIAMFQARYDVRIAQCGLDAETRGKGLACVGMTTMEAVHTACCVPDKKNTTTTAAHLKVQWIYQSPIG
jgi:hypothetical protein